MALHRFPLLFVEITFANKGKTGKNENKYYEGNAWR